MIPPSLSLPESFASIPCPKHKSDVTFLRSDACCENGIRFQTSKPSLCRNGNGNPFRKKQKIFSETDI